MRRNYDNTTKKELISEIKEHCREYTQHICIRDGAMFADSIWIDETRFELPLSCCGDYVGSSVEESNRLYYSESATYSRVVKCDSFGYSAHNAYIRGTQFKRLNKEELIELFEDLCHVADYPCLDEDGMSRIEWEWAQETYENCYRSDIKRELERRFDYNRYPRIYEAFEAMEDEQLDAAVWVAMESTNTYWVNEGNSMYLDVDRIMPVLVPAIVQIILNTRPSKKVA